MVRMKGMAVLIAAVLSSAAPASAQVTRGAPTPEIVVSGISSEEMSDWLRAESEHVIVTSNGNEAELIRVARDLEKLHQLLASIYGVDRRAGDVAKLKVTIYASASDMRKLNLQNRRSAEGPFADAVALQRYYDPRSDGAVLAIARDDQLLDLNTRRAWQLDCDDVTSAGGDCFRMTPDPHMPAVREWEDLLHGGYAQHFLLTYRPDAYPRWFLDGIGALYSTFKVRRNGSVEYPVLPAQLRQVMRSYGDVSVDDILSGRYLNGEMAKGANWTPYHAWALAHFFFDSQSHPARRAQFGEYLAALRRGAPAAEAARVFGDMRRLQREVASHSKRERGAVARTAPLPALDTAPDVTRLTRAAAAVIDTDLAPDVRPAMTAKSRIADLPFDARAALTLAKAACQRGDASECVDIAEQILAREPGNGDAMAWKGTALIDQAVAGPADARPAQLASARQLIERAAALDNESPLPLIALFQSYVKAGERVPDPVLRGLVRAIQLVPAAPEPRLWLSEELVRQGNGDAARKLLLALLRGPYESPEKAAARSMLGAL